jgi:hypothetical protein
MVPHWPARRRDGSRELQAVRVPPQPTEPVRAACSAMSAAVSVAIAANRNMAVYATGGRRAPSTRTLLLIDNFVSQASASLRFKCVPTTTRSGGVFRQRGPAMPLQRMRAAAYIFVSPRDALSPPRALPGDRVPPRLDPILSDEQFKAEFN